MANATFSPMLLGTVQVISLSTSSQAISTAFGARTRFVRLATGADGCFIEFAASPTATTSKHYLPPNTVEIVKVSPSTKLAAISTGSPTGKLTVTELK